MVMACGTVGRGGEMARRSWGLLFHHKPLSLNASSSPSWWRPLCGNTAAAAAAADDGRGVEEKKTKIKWKMRKEKNLFEVAKYLPSCGVGYLMARSRWSAVDSFYRITKINIYVDRKSGKAWGIFHKHGLPVADRPKRINNAKKLGWKYVPESKMKQDSESGTMEKSCYTVPEPKLKQDSETSTVEKSCYVPEPKSKQDSKTAPVEKSGYVPESKIKQDSESGTIETSSYSTDQS